MESFYEIVRVCFVTGVRHLGNADNYYSLNTLMHMYALDRNGNSISGKIFAKVGSDIYGNKWRGIKIPTKHKS